MNHSTIRKLQKIIKQGHVPNRGLEPYIKTYALANCFEHACFNLSNLQLKYGHIKECDTYDFSHFRSPEKDETFEKFANYLKETGLNIEKCSKNKILKWSVRNFLLQAAKTHMDNRKLKRYDRSQSGAA